MQSLQYLLLLLQAIFTLCFAIPVDPQSLFALLPQTSTIAIDSANNNHDQAAPPTRIAIIGSGITGSTAAFTLAEAARLRTDRPFQITLFERNAIIGGRITATQVFDRPEFTIDTCAATFSLQTDVCLAQAARNVGLPTVAFSPAAAGVGIWDGHSFTGFIEDQGFRDPRAWTLARKLRWYQRYGDAPWQFANRVTFLQQTYSQLAVSAFASLAGEIRPRNLENLTTRALCANEEMFDCAEHKNRLFVDEVIDAGIRERFFGDVDQLNGLDALLALGGESQASITGGNLRLVDRLITLSKATVRLNAAVGTITQEGIREFRLDYVQAGANRTELFEAVIIATPLALSNLTIGSGLGAQLPAAALTSPQYVDSFVTHFTTANRLNASFFNTSDPGPQNILTTSIGKGADEVPFFSLTLIDQVFNLDTTKNENLFKLVSRRLISDAEIAQYVEQNQSPTEPTISWIDREQLPQTLPRLGLDEPIQDRIEILPGLFYAGAGEQVAGTVEFGCRMGTNAARLAFAEFS